MASTISQKDLFNLPEVKAAQELQKQNRYGSHKHRAAFDAIKGLAESHGVGQFIGEY